MRNFLTVIASTLIINISAIAQSDSIKTIYSYDSITRLYTTMHIDLNNGDTTKIQQPLGRYVKINKNGVKLIEGQKEGGIGHLCGCEPRKQGLWTYRYSSGQIDSIGEYICDSQFGKWKYYYPNGLIKKEQNFAVEGTEYFVRLVLPKGQFKEFDEKGQLRLKGQYKIVAVKDSIDVIDPNTYNFVKIWGNTLKSAKTGIWIYYDSFGAVLRKEKY